MEYLLNVLTPHHLQMIGPALRVYCWLVAHITDLASGAVAGGAEISSTEIGAAVGKHAETVLDHLARLDGRYIVRELGSHGYRIQVIRQRASPQDPFFRPDPSHIPKSQSTTVDTTDSNRSGGSVVRSFGGSVVSPDHRTGSPEVSPPSSPLHSPVSPSPLPSPSAAEDEIGPAGETEAGQMWRAAAGPAGRNQRPEIRQALQRCRPLSLEANALTVMLPPEPDRQRVLSIERLLRAALRSDHRRPLELVWAEPNPSQHEARAGP